MRTRSVTVAAAFAALALLAPAAPASADKPWDNYQWGGSDEFTYEECGTTLHESVEFSGHTLIKVVKESDGQAFLAHDNYRFTSVVTNLETGGAFVLSGTGTFKEIHATLVEGTVWEFTAQDAGQPLRITDLDGNVLAFERGVVKLRSVFDTLGDGEPGGEFVHEYEPVFHGQFETGDLGFCDFVEMYT